jgi:hypothetical protein
MDKKEVYVAGAAEPYSLRCCKCNFEFIKNLTINDNISEVVCPNNCVPSLVELNLGKKVRR